MQTLHEFYRDHYSLERPLRPSTAMQIDISLSAFDRWAGHPVTLAELSDSLVNRWIVDLIACRRAATVKRKRGDVLCVWRYAALEHRLCAPPCRVRRVSVPRRTPDAWSLAEVARLVSAARNIPGTYPSGIKRADWWELFLGVAYDTALRLSDVLSLPFDVATMQSFRVLQSKSRSEFVRRLSPSTIAVAARTLHVERELLLPWNYRREVIWHHWRKYLLIPAGLPATRRNGPQKLRRTSASHLERVAPGSARTHLGHATPGLAERHYLDPSVCGAEPPLPPNWEG